MDQLLSLIMQLAYKEGNICPIFQIEKMRFKVF